MALVRVYATPRRRLPRPGARAPAQIDFRIITEIPRNNGRDELEIRITGGFSIGTWAAPSPTPPGPP